MMTCFSGPNMKIRVNPPVDSWKVQLRQAECGLLGWEHHMKIVLSNSSALFHHSKPLHFCLSHTLVCSREKPKSGLLSFCDPIKDLSGFSLVSHRAFYINVSCRQTSKIFFVSVKNSSCVWEQRNILLITPTMAEWCSPPPPPCLSLPPLFMLIWSWHHRGTHWPW